jgi:hypothetical protein
MRDPPQSRSPETFPAAGPVSNGNIDAPDRRSDAGMLPQRFASAFFELAEVEQARVLRQLLPYVGTMARLVLGNGTFARYATPSSLGPAVVAPGETARIGAPAITDLVTYLEQREPELPRRVLAGIEADARRSAHR